MHPDFERMTRASDVRKGVRLRVSYSRNFGSIPSKARGFDFLRRYQTRLQNHAASYSMGTGITVSGNNHSHDIMLTLGMDDGISPTTPPTHPHAQGTTRPKSLNHIPDDPSSANFTG